ncbi:VTC domain-containing protein [Peribacillus aracenensis]|uniref:VTC domain-containing protein n=1 Tax=Peribacillus aracenensis TaxID=2976708 RepID=UPI0021A3D029|nr:VTC domain-containing protein [Peribacillus sp. BBB004]
MNGLKGRRELKHAITKADCHSLRKNLQNFMRLDPHGLDGKYLIRSVYFDKFDNKLLRQKTEGFYHRDKFRAFTPRRLTRLAESEHLEGKSTTPLYLVNSNKVCETAFKENGRQTAFLRIIYSLRYPKIFGIPFLLNWRMASSGLFLHI